MKNNVIVINVVMDYLVGGAYIGLMRIARNMPQYKWEFSTEVNKNANIVIYMNNHRHYTRAKEYNIKHIIQRKTGERSLKIETPDDLGYVICSSKRSYDFVKHKNKILVYNGIDFVHLSSICPKSNVDFLVAESRIGIGQRVDLACKYALKHNRHLTILGGKANLDENTYFVLKKQYPMFKWVGTVSEDESLSYIKGCNSIIVSNSSHGVANQVIEAVACNKNIIDLTTNKLEIPDKDNINITCAIEKYKDIFSKLMEGNKNMFVLKNFKYKDLFFRDLEQNSPPGTMCEILRTYDPGRMYECVDIKTKKIRRFCISEKARLGGQPGITERLVTNGYVSDEDKDFFDGIEKCFVWAE